LSFSQTVVLGALAGFTIYLGLPLARLQILGSKMRVALAMFSVGVLAFLFVDVIAEATHILEGSVEGFKDGDESLGHVLGMAALLAGGFFLGSAAIVERRIWPRALRLAQMPVKWTRPTNRHLPPA
jgi:zinc transporter, ZIP family